MASAAISEMCSSSVAARSFMDLIEAVGFEALIFGITTGVILLVRRQRRKVCRFNPPRTGLSQAQMGEGAVKQEKLGTGSDSSFAKLTPGPSYVTQQVDLAISARIPAAKALAVYSSFRVDGSHQRIPQQLRADGSKHTALDYYVALVQSAGRAGRPEVVGQLLDDMAESGIHRPIGIFESAMRLLARKRFFREALSVFDRLEQAGFEASPVTISCLVGFSAEIGDGDRAVGFFRRLEAQKAVSMRAAMTVLRVFALRNDWPSSADVVRSSWRCCGNVDSILLNTALETAISVGQVAGAEAMLSEEVGVAVADAISFNIVLKGLAQQGNIEKAVELVAIMRTRGLTPTLITLNTVMDTAVRAGRPNAAWQVLEMIVLESELEPDKCTCTTLVKALRKEASPEQVRKVMDLAESVLPSCSLDLSGRLLNGILETATRICEVGVALRALTKMRELRLPISALELKALATVAAQSGDLEACGRVQQCADECASQENVGRWVAMPARHSREQKPTAPLVPR
eukprot:TRINITY_DN44570_c0_g1_i1.p1 TRINITY_DN44570_c0_g1~~TRINITY_DN44570_c0_g1_i1.p1  ORF type:complete len:517 (-),score=87.10 TRINITY_DN44570_c0_g1_i1:172-1722(-)